jgi:hypothetical protein
VSVYQESRTWRSRRTSRGVREEPHLASTGAPGSWSDAPLLRGAASPSTRTRPLVCPVRPFPRGGCVGVAPDARGRWQGPSGTVADARLARRRSSLDVPGAPSAFGDAPGSSAGVRDAGGGRRFDVPEMALVSRRSLRYVARAPKSPAAPIIHEPAKNAARAPLMTHQRRMVIASRARTASVDGIVLSFGHCRSNCRAQSNARLTRWILLVFPGSTRVPTRYLAATPHWEDPLDRQNS